MVFSGEIWRLLKWGVVGDDGGRRWKGCERVRWLDVKAWWLLVVGCFSYWYDVLWVLIRGYELDTT
ncbi:hypothetical protein Hanom_Chr13g01239951 [Helianthus anomalus]